VTHERDFTEATVSDIQILATLQRDRKKTSDREKPHQLNIFTATPIPAARGGAK
jgi:hypothetical protein